MKKAMTIRQSEELYGISKSIINRIENGLANPSVEVIWRLVVLLNDHPMNCFIWEHSALFHIWNKFVTFFNIFTLNKCKTRFGLHSVFLLLIYHAICKNKNFV